MMMSSKKASLMLLTISRQFRSFARFNKVASGTNKVMEETKNPQRPKVYGSQQIKEKKSEKGNEEKQIIIEGESKEEVNEELQAINKANDYEDLLELYAKNNVGYTTTQIHFLTRLSSKVFQGKIVQRNKHE